MRCHCGISLEEVHQAAYLTLRDWTYSSHSGWRKKGFTRTIRKTRRDSYGYYDGEEEVEDFDSTYEAFGRQQESEGPDERGP